MATYGRVSPLGGKCSMFRTVHTILCDHTLNSNACLGDHKHRHLDEVQQSLWRSFPPVTEGARTIAGLLDDAGCPTRSHGSVRSSGFPYRCCTDALRIAASAPKKNPGREGHGTDPYLPRRDNGPGELACRSRMATAAGQTIYLPRSIGECIHPRWCNCKLIRLNVRGDAKPKP
jgi:hypothetical protein